MYFLNIKLILNFSIDLASHSTPNVTRISKLFNVISTLVYFDTYVIAAGITLSNLDPFVILFDEYIPPSMKETVFGFLILLAVRFLIGAACVMELTMVMMFNAMVLTVLFASLLDDMLHFDTKLKNFPDIKQTLAAFKYFSRVNIIFHEVCPKLEQFFFIGLVFFTVLIAFYNYVNIKMIHLFPLKLAWLFPFSSIVLILFAELLVSLGSNIFEESTNVKGLSARVVRWHAKDLCKRKLKYCKLKCEASQPLFFSAQFLGCKLVVFTKSTKSTFTEGLRDTTIDALLTF